MTELEALIEGLLIIKKYEKDPYMECTISNSLYIGSDDIAKMSEEDRKKIEEIPGWELNTSEGFEFYL